MSIVGNRGRGWEGVGGGGIYLHFILFAQFFCKHETVKKLNSLLIRRKTRERLEKRVGGRVQLRVQEKRDQRPSEFFGATIGADPPMVASLPGVRPVDSVTGRLNGLCYSPS